MSVERDAARRESPVQGREVKTDAAQQTAKATNEKTAGRHPRQEIARQSEERDSQYASRSHKSTVRLTGSTTRTDSREQIYSTLGAWDGQSHE